MLKIQGGFDWSWGSLAILIGEDLPDGNVAVAKPLEMQVTNRGIIVAPTFRLEKNEAQQLFDLLWKEGYRPNDGTGNSSHVAAIQYHLEDMRRLVFPKE